MTAVLPCRRGFVEACLAASPPGTADWIGVLSEVVTSVVARHAVDVDRRAVYPAESIAALRGVGAFGVLAPVEHGGLGLGPSAAALAVELVAAACASTAAILMFHCQVVRRVVDHGTAAQRRDDLPRLASGEWLGASAWSEPGAGADKSRTATRIVVDGGRWAATGAKSYCTGLEGARILHVLLSAPTAGGSEAPTFVQLRAGAPGVDVSEVYPLMGLRGSSTGTVQLREAALSAADVVGPAGSGMQLMRENHAILMNPGLLALGIARAAYAEARLAASGQWPGMQATASYQNTRFVLAEIEMSLGSAYAYAAQAARAVQAGVPQCDVECLKVKAHASDAAAAITASVINLVGSRGFHAGWPVERHYRDARATVLMGPTNEIIKERIASQFLG